MADLVHLSEVRLAHLRECEANLAAALGGLGIARAEVGDVADRLLWAVRVALELRADGQGHDLTVDPGLEAEGGAALARIASAQDDVRQARAANRREIARLASANTFVVGDMIVSDGRELLCQSIFCPAHDPTLTEVTFTADGAPVEKRLHSWPLSDDGHPIIDVEDRDAVRFERWWGGGLRAGGYVHPVSRRVVRTD